MKVLWRKVVDSGWWRTPNSAAADRNETCLVRREGPSHEFCVCEGEARDAWGWGGGGGRGYDGCRVWRWNVRDAIFRPSGGDSGKNTVKTKIRI